MGIKKIVEIRGVGKFLRCKTSGDVEFRKLTLIFGENGRGKSTLTAVMRSLQTQDPNLISERATLNSSDDQHIHIRLDDSTQAKFTSGSWLGNVPAMEIFDATFIHENIFAGLYVDHDHKKKLYRVIIGEQGVLLNAAVDTLDENIKSLNKDIAKKKNAIQVHITNDLTIEKFIALPKVDGLDKLIVAKEQEITAIRSANEIASKSHLAKLDLPKVPIDLPMILGKTLADLEKEAAQSVNHHLNLCLGKGGEPWVKEGLEFIREANSCPFCGHTLDGNELITAYQAYFSAAYKKLQEEIREYDRNTKTTFGPDAWLEWQKVFDSNVTLLQYWQRFVNINIEELQFDDIKPNLHSLYQAINTALDAKAAAPLDVAEIGDELNTAIQDYSKLLERVSAYNLSVEAANVIIQDKKQQTIASSLNSALYDLAIYENTMSRHDSAIEELCASYKELRFQKKTKEKEKKAAKEKLDLHTNQIFTKFEGSINSYLELFGADFRISNTSRRYFGGKASSSYELLINATPVELGDDSTPPGTPAFRNTLSSGDKSALALAFFLARLDHDPNLASKLVVLDDPISSMDRFRMNCTVQLIARLSQKSCKTIVLSHDPGFLKKIHDSMPSMSPQCLHLRRAGERTEIGEWDIVNENQSQYIQDYIRLFDYVQNGHKSSDLRDIARKIRPLLEQNLRFANGWMGEFINSIRNAPVGDDLEPMKEQLAELEDLNNYSKKYHHSENSNADSEPISDTELRSFANRTLRFVSGSD